MPLVPDPKLGKHLSAFCVYEFAYSELSCEGDQIMDGL